MKSVQLKLLAYRESLLMEHWQALRKDQSVLLGFMGGVISATLCAITWAFITVVSGYQIVIMAVLLGFCVGSAIKISGMAIDPLFRFFGIILSLCGCLLGNLISTVKIISSAQGTDFVTVLFWLNVSTIGEILPSILSLYDLLTYGIAAICGYYFSATNHKIGTNYLRKKRVM